LDNANDRIIIDIIANITVPFIVAIVVLVKCEDHLGEV